MAKGRKKKQSPEFPVATKRRRRNDSGESVDTNNIHENSSNQDSEILIVESSNEEVTNLSILTAIKNLSSEVKTVSDKVKTVSDEVKTVSDKVKTVSDEVKTGLAKIEEKISGINTRIDKVEESIQTCVNVNVQQDKEIEQLKIELRKLNLIVVNVQEAVNENLFNIISDLFKNELGLNSELIPVDTVSRIGKLMNNRIRPIRVKFSCEYHRNQVWKNRFKLKNSNIFINEDLPPATLENRKLLRLEARKLSALGKKTVLLGDKLAVNGVIYELNDQKQLYCTNRHFIDKKSSDATDLSQHVSTSATTAAGPSTLPRRVTATSAATNLVRQARMEVDDYTEQSFSQSSQQ